MTANKAIQYMCAVLLIISSIAIAFIQVFDLKDVAGGTLMYIAQAFLLAGSIFGLDYYLQKFRQMMNQGSNDSTKMTIIVVGCLLCTQLPVSAQLLVHDEKGFRSTYDLGLKCPRQVEWIVRSSDLGNTKRVPSWKFVSVRHHDLLVSEHDDFRNSKYDRGHMCPAGDRSSSIVDMKSTFDMVNVAAQVPSLNRGQWLATENECRRYAITYDSVCVLAVPIFLHRDTTFIGANHVAVPHAFMKACWLPGRDSLLNVWFYFNE